MNPRHTSYSDRQLKAVYRVSGKVNISRKKRFNRKWMNRCFNLYKELIRYTVLHTARILPDNTKGFEHVMPTEAQLAKIREHFKKDWETCKAKAANVGS